MERHTDTKHHSFNGPHITLPSYQRRALNYPPMQSYPYRSKWDKTPFTSQIAPLSLSTRTNTSTHCNKCAVKMPPC